MISEDVAVLCASELLVSNQKDLMSNKKINVYCLFSNKKRMLCDMNNEKNTLCLMFRLHLFCFDNSDFRGCRSLVCKGTLCEQSKGSYEQ